ncbi:MAG: dipeptidyl aminopeptidase [Candidatus Aminicenantes bacterium RBG_13_59_9]|nr:MAG: dipeptidyl aminopeptidase [Candidatus Aminicenantes bacterium RBG_13_59_9]
MRKCVLAALFIGLCLSLSFGLDQTRGGNPQKLLAKEAFMEMESVGSPQISPDGKQVLFTRGWTDKLNDQTRSNLWIVDIDGKRIRELTHGNWRDSSPVWSPDGKKIAFLSERDETTQVHVMWLDTREIAQLTHLERAASDLCWSPDGRKLAFTCFMPDDSNPLPVKLPERPSGAKWAAPAVIVDRLNWRSDGRGFLPKGYNHVFTIDAELGGTPRRITSGDFSHSAPEWSADGQKIFFSAIRKPDSEYQRGDSEIYSVDLASLEVKALTDRKGPDREARVSPDGKWIAYTGYDDKHYTNHLSSLYLMDSTGGNKKLLAGRLPDSPSGLTWAPDNSGLYFLQPESGVINLAFISLDGKIRRMTEGVQTLSGISVAANGQAATTVSSFHKPGYLATFNVLKPSGLKTLVDVNEDVLSGISLGQAEELRFKSPDGLDLQGWLIKPAEFEPGKKYPMVLWIHGGPWSMYSVSFNWDWQWFASSGYAVFYMNPRGSTGYGQDFVNGIQYSYPGKDYDDLMAGVDAALAEGFIDKDNLFVCGGSGGGVLTAWIVGHTNRFRAAVSMRPVINWHSFVGITDGASWYDQFQKFPWEDPLEYAVRSPLNFVSNVQTPTMVMTGEADLRTPIGQSEEYYRALKMLKKETLLVRMPEEYHGWRRPSHRLLQDLYLMAWFEKYRLTAAAPAK